MTESAETLPARKVVLDTTVDVFMGRLASGEAAPGDSIIIEEMHETDAIRAVYRSFGQPAVASESARPLASVSEIRVENEPLYGRNGTRI
jgi:hypothetical protein